MAGGDILGGVVAGIMIHVVINAILPTVMGFVQQAQSGYARKTYGVVR